ncbi:hypothetical protein [Azospirillum griseum]|uniref:Uncharacterized protein n=1 Tax=Azospirillum griseum TaxID=2496639 RepID=A0A3S0I0U1_9PROT|nr:hypothetical protein [Azospirillum griseum]RTR20246.1 hypothetical protein EJ903_11975 [Azospirillum griseum]
MTMGYTGWELPEAERARLLALFPARYACVIAHHITLEHGVPYGHPLPYPVGAEVIATVDDEAGMQALIVALNGATDRPDGSTFHITWSLEPGRHPVEANTVIHEFGWRPVEPVAIQVFPNFFFS